MSKNQNERNELFIKACAGGFLDVVSFMLDAGGIDPNYSDKDNHTALWYVVHNKHYQILKRLLYLNGIHKMTINRAIEEAHKLGENEVMADLLEYPCRC